MALAQAVAVAVPFFFIVVASSSSAAPADSLFGCYDSIVSFGDSLSDTGNGLLPELHQGPCLACNPPNGRTYFHRPTGRFSDGRIVIDFIAQSLGLPLLQPYFPEAYEDAAQRRRTFSAGVNFAVAGASVLSYEFYDKIFGYQNPYTTVSLGTQMEWFRTFLAGFPDGRKYLERSLIILGPIGGNDYNHLFMQERSLNELRSLVPIVVSKIGSTIQAFCSQTRLVIGAYQINMILIMMMMMMQELIELGVITILVPGNLPFGCLPSYLTQYENDYDPQIGCLSWLNQFSRYHNDLLQKELQRIRKLHPHVNIMYGDYYNDAMRMIWEPNS
ncbi:GDSL esterase/lipase At1g28600-like isoform X4 [Andrographis paniculata]|uniref:GDSL esterase/lipase At1g28600-like isoform X4 n=1 Tax=Andrographis paniculata TaxID=175694 RepID=UPI0021E7C099|nr:GDSL esterase/lipase At1g28600-like isoform X4 [Andrographis paniculata]